MFDLNVAGFQGSAAFDWECICAECNNGVLAAYFFEGVLQSEQAHEVVDICENGNPYSLGRAAGWHWHIHVVESGVGPSVLGQKMSAFK